MTTVTGLVGYYEPWYVQIIKGIVIFAVGLQMVPIVLLVERKLLGRFQLRYGPNRVGPFGMLLPLADIGKLLFKEQSRPTTSIGALFIIAPLISILTAVASLCRMMLVVASRTTHPNAVWMAGGRALLSPMTRESTPLASSNERAPASSASRFVVR